MDLTHDAILAAVELPDVLLRHVRRFGAESYALADPAETPRPFEPAAAPGVETAP